MTQPLNYTPKAIEALLSYPCPGAPGTAAGMRYIADKLRQAQVFVLGSSGELLDRSKPRPEVPGVVFRPPFPVVALEYQANQQEWGNTTWNSEKCSRRIALAWDWTDDVPPLLRPWRAPDLRPGVVIASIAYYDGSGLWMPVGAAAHMAYDGEWMDLATEKSPFRDAMLAEGRLSKAVAASSGFTFSPIALLPEAVGLGGAQFGAGMVIESIKADLMDEVNAYTDLCYALACKNVSTREHAAPSFLNRQRIKAGKLPLKGFHVLELSGGDGFPAGGGGGGDRAAARSHLRRGHIRRLGADRVTWVNSTIVRGRGFVDKVYAA